MLLNDPYTVHVLGVLLALLNDHNLNWQSLNKIYRSSDTRPLTQNLDIMVLWLTNEWVWEECI